MFEIDDLWPHPLPGYTTGHLWNGWSCPVFEKETVDILRSFEGFTDIEYDEATDTFIVDLGEDCDDDSRYQYSKGRDIEYAGTTKRVYVIEDGWF